MRVGLIERGGKKGGRRPCLFYVVRRGGLKEGGRMGKDRSGAEIEEGLLEEVVAGS